MQITIRSSNIIFFKQVDDYLTKDEILKQAGISITDDKDQPVDLSTSIMLGGGAFDDQGYQVRSSLRDSTILWQVKLPNGNIIDESANALTLQVATSQAEYDALQKQYTVSPKPETDHKLIVAKHQTLTLGRIAVNKPLPTVSLKLDDNYAITTAKMLIYPVVGSGKSVNKNLVNFGNITVNDTARTITWMPKNQDLYPFGPNDNDITSLVYVVQAEKYQAPKAVTKQSTWGFDPTELLTDTSTVTPVDQSPKVAQAETVKPKVEKAKPKTETPVAPVTKAQSVPIRKIAPETKSSTTIAKPATKVIWYKQQVKDGIANVKALADGIVTKVKTTQAKQKKQSVAKTKKVTKPKPKKTANNKKTNQASHGILKYVATVLIGLGLAGSGTYVWRETSLKPYQAQINTVQHNQNQINSLLDQKPLTTNNLKKAIQLSSDNSKLIKQLPVSDNNVWRARAYNQLELQNETLVAKAKSKIKTQNTKQTSIN